MKIIGIIGSPRGRESSTLKLMESALNAAKASGAETAIFDVADMNIEYCTACLNCYKTGQCYINDDFNEVYEELLHCDGFVLGSPVYFNNVSAQLKTFMDRTTDCRHCLYLQKKYGMAVVSTASSGMEQTAALLEEYINMLGAYSVGSVKMRLPMIPQNMETACKRSYAMGTDLVEAIQSSREYPEQTKVMNTFVSVFKNAVGAYKHEWPWEYKHYIIKGWLTEKV